MKAVKNSLISHGIWHGLHRKSELFPKKSIYNALLKHVMHLSDIIPSPPCYFVILVETRSINEFQVNTKSNLSKIASENGLRTWDYFARIVIPD